MADYPAAQNLVGTTLAPNVRPTVVASAASLANSITHAITKVSGTNAVTGFQLPAGFTGVFCVIPTGNFTGATGGTYANDGTTASIPIGLAFTAVTGKAIYFVTDGLLIYPSYA